MLGLEEKKKDQDERKQKHISLSNNELAKFIRFQFRFVSTDTRVWAGYEADAWLDLGGK